MIKPAYPTDVDTAAAWLAWCGEIDPLTRNRNHPEGCQCHHCPVARGKLASAEVARAIIAEAEAEIREREFLESQRGTLRSMLAEIPADDVLGRASIEARLRQVEDEMADPLPGRGDGA